MIGLTFAIIIFNIIAFKTNKHLTTNQIIHIWVFTIAYQNLFDLFVDMKYHGYWYFTKEVNWRALPAHTVLIPPVNMMFLNGYPFQSKLQKKILYVFVFVISILIYEFITLLPEPWGYFHYGWWSIIHSACIDPILLLILLGYYKWIYKIELRK